MKRLFLALALSIIPLLVVIFLHNHTAVDVPPSSEQTTIRVVLWEYEDQPYAKTLIDQFEELHPDIHVEVTSYNSNCYADSIHTLLTGENLLDVIFLPEVSMLYELMEKDIPLSLDQLTHRDNLTMESYPTAASLQDPRSGQLMALPYQSSVFLLYYNQTIFDELGIRYPTDGMTWEDFCMLADEVAAALRERGSSQYAVYLPQDAKQQLLYTLPSSFSPEQDSFSLLRPGLEMFQWLQANGISNSAAASDAIEANEKLFLQGNYAMFVTKASFLNLLSSYAPAFSWNIASLPHWSCSEAPICPMETSVCCINQLSHHYEESWKFVQYMCGFPGANAMATHLLLPGFRSKSMDGALLDAAYSHNIDGQHLLPPSGVSTCTLASEKNGVLLKGICKIYENALLGFIHVEDALAQMEALRGYQGSPANAGLAESASQLQQ